MRGIHRWSVDSPLKGSVMQRSSPWHDITIWWKYWIIINYYATKNNLFIYISTKAEYQNVFSVIRKSIFFMPFLSCYPVIALGLMVGWEWNVGTCDWGDYRNIAGALCLVEILIFFNENFVPMWWNSSAIWIQIINLWLKFVPVLTASIWSPCYKMLAPLDV